MKTTDDGALCVRLGYDRHKRFKAACAVLGKTMTAVLLERVDEVVPPQEVAVSTMGDQKPPTVNMDGMPVKEDAP